MAVRLRLMRLGKIHRPYYRVCVFDKRKARGGKYIEAIGHYDPLIADDAKKVVIDKARAEYWLGVGASASETVESFLRDLEVPGLARPDRRRRTKKASDAQEGAAKKPGGKSSGGMAKGKTKVSKSVVEQGKRKGAERRERKAARVRAAARAEARAAATAAASSS